MKWGLSLLVLFVFGCENHTKSILDGLVRQDSAIVHSSERSCNSGQLSILLSRPVYMHDYFNAIDSLCRFIDSSYGVSLNEYEFIRANPVILDSLRSQDYYEAKERGVLILNQQDCLVIHSGQQLSVPDSNQLLRIRLFLKQIRIDVNVPEYTLRIWCGDSLIHRCIVRVGRNERKFLALAGREVDLKTPIGKGRIVRIERDPLYINPVNGERYYRTRRDDGRYTMLPRIPFLEPEINGIRSGALLHPTTNKSTLGKAISNGCIGMSEADAWTLYYHAPLGTPIEFRYDLNVIDENGNSKKLDNIYNR